MNAPRHRLHPIVTIAATTLTVAALLVIAALTGILPHPASPAAAPAANVATDTPQVAGVARVQDAYTGAASALAARAPQTASAPRALPSAPRANPASSGVASPAATPRSKPSHAGGTPPHTASQPARTSAAPAVCTTCGTVSSVRTVERQGEAGLIGPVAGGIIGGAVGSRIGSGSGRAIATIAGAAGGAAVGTEVERRARSTTHYIVTVRMDSGSSRTFEFTAPPGVSGGDRVRVAGESIVRA